MQLKHEYAITFALYKTGSNYRLPVLIPKQNIITNFPWVQNTEEILQQIVCKSTGDWIGVEQI